MSVLDRVRSTTGIETTKRRHIREETPTLEEISGPDKLTDERKKSWREWASENKKLAVVGMVFAALGLIIFLMLTAQYAPDALSMFWHRREITFGVIGLVAGIILGTRKLLEKMTQWDQVTIKTSSNNSKRYYGYYLTSDLGDYDLFVPVAGFTFMGYRSSVYNIGDISRQIIRKRGTPWQEDDPAIMRLDPSWTGVTRTESGAVVVTICDGFEPDDQSRESNLKPITPKQGSKERISDMRQQLEKAREEKEHQKELADKYKRQRDNVMEEMDRPVDEVLDQHIDTYERIEEARSRDGRTSERTDNGVAPSKEVEAELGGDSDD